MQALSISSHPLSNGILRLRPVFFSLSPRQNPIFPSLSFASQFSLQSRTMPPSSLNIVAEYAKSNRSKCQGCSKSIANKELRLGLITRDPRGYDATRWHHMSCVSLDLDSTESIKGFHSLKGVDQEALKKLLEDVDRKSQAKVEQRSEDVESKTQENHAKKRRSEDIEDKTQENHTEKLKSEDIEDKTQENHTEKLRSEDTENKTQENPAIKRKSEDMENKTQENPASKRKSEDIEDKTQENRAKKQRLSITSGAEFRVALSASDIKGKYKDATLLPKWKAFRTLIFLEKDDGLVDCSRIAAFDFDGCLVNTSVKRIGADAWSIMYPSVPEKLQKLHKDGFKLVIFTNESNIERWKNSRQKAVDSKIGRLENFIKRVKVPIQVFIACGFDRGGATDPFRKPKPGMWHIMESNFNSGIEIDMKQSFYVGDAAGRKSDHSSADIKFAETVGLKFYLPEEYFDA